MVGGGGIRRPTPPSLATSDTLYVCTRFFLNIFLLVRLLLLSLLILFPRSSCCTYAAAVSFVTAVVAAADITVVAAVANVNPCLMLVWTYQVFNAGLKANLLLLLSLICYRTSQLISLLYYFC
jgi:hypothetical protein